MLWLSVPYSRGQNEQKNQDSGKDDAYRSLDELCKSRGQRHAAPAASLAYLGLGRSFTAQHESGKARAAYEQFITLWNGADPEIPVFRQAKLEYSQLPANQLAHR